MKTHDLLGRVHEIMEFDDLRAVVPLEGYTAALAEEMRTANLLKLAELIDDRFGGQLRVNERLVTPRVLVKTAAERMGLG